MRVDNLRIVVVPTETFNDINQESSVDEILSCEEADIYEIGDYCQAQNNEEICYGWTFLIDIKNKINYTGKEL